MSYDLDDRLHPDLVRLADRAPLAGHRLDDITTLARRRRTRRTVARATLGVAAVAAMGVSVFLVRHEPSSGTASDPNERPLIVIPTGSTPNITRPDALTLRLSDGQTLAFAVVGMPFYDGYRQFTTIDINGAGTGRVQPSDHDIALIPEPEVGGYNTVIYWTGLPATATRVELHGGDGTVVWQRPVHGIAAFPVSGHGADTLVALDVGGHAVAHASWDSTHLVSSSGPTPQSQNRHFSSLADPSSSSYGPIDATKLAGQTAEETLAHQAFADGIMESCLAHHGAQAWTECIRSTEAAVKAHP
jgi:hypothetical protein